MEMAKSLDCIRCAWRQGRLRHHQTPSLCERCWEGIRNADAEMVTCKTCEKPFLTSLSDNMAAICGRCGEHAQVACRRRREENKKLRAANKELKEHIVSRCDRPSCQMCQVEKEQADGTN